MRMTEMTGKSESVRCSALHSAQIVHAGGAHR